MFSHFSEAQEVVHEFLHKLLTKYYDASKVQVQWFGNGFYLRNLESEQDSPFCVLGGSLEIHRMTVTQQGTFLESECYQEWHNSRYPFIFNDKRTNHYLDIPMKITGSDEFDEDNGANKEQIIELFKNYNYTFMDALERHETSNNSSIVSAFHEYALTQPHKFYFKDNQLWLRMLMGGQFSYNKDDLASIKEEMIGQLEDGWLENGADIFNDYRLWPASSLLNKAYWIEDKEND